MRLPSPPDFMRLLLLLLLQFPAIATAVPSCTQPELLHRIARPATTSTPTISPARSNFWSSLYHFLFHPSEERAKSQSPSRPATSFVDPTTFESAIFKPAPKLLAQYGDQLVLRFNISTELEASSLAEASDTLYLDVWRQSGNWVDVRLAKAVVPSLLGLLPASLQHAHKPLMQGSDLARAISETYPAASLSDSNSHSPSKWLSRAFSLARHESRREDNDTYLFFDDYQPLAMIERWMVLMESLFSSHVKVISIGSTYEGRDIPALRVGVHPATSGNPAAKRETVLIGGGQHAREWISTSTVSYVAHALITSYGKDPAATKLLESLDFVFIPSLNPDGYQYSWDYDRLWRKNRQPTSLPFCRGMDLDRSWSFMWDGERTRNNPCSESFAGEVPFDAVESRRLAEWAKSEIATNNVEFVGFIDLHSYSQQILYPYAFTCSTDPPTLEDLQELGQGLAKSIRFVSREHYKVISACEGNVAASGAILPRFEGGGGSALDWFYHEIGVRKAFQIKLRDKGSYGFLLPPEHIVPTGMEILNLVKYFGEMLTTSVSPSEGGYMPPNGNLQDVLSGATASKPD